MMQIFLYGIDIEKQKKIMVTSPRFPADNVLLNLSKFVMFSSAFPLFLKDLQKCLLGHTLL